MSEEKITADMLRELFTKTMPPNIDNMMKLLGLGHLNYSTKQLEIIEDIIDKQYPLGHKPMATTLIPFAYYLGECIIRSVPGARWYFPPDSDGLSSVSVSLKSGTSSHLVYPFTRVSKFWRDRTDRMSTMVRMTQFMSEVQLDRKYLATRIGKDGWIQTYYGDCYRMMIADKQTMQPPPGKSYMQAMTEMGDDDEK